MLKNFRINVCECILKTIFFCKLHRYKNGKKYKFPHILRCSFSILRQHFSRFNEKCVSNLTGNLKKIVYVCKLLLNWYVFVNWIRKKIEGHELPRILSSSVLHEYFSIFFKRVVNSQFWKLWDEYMRIFPKLLIFR